MPLAGKTCAWCKSTRPINCFGLEEDGRSLRMHCRSCEKAIANNENKKKNGSNKRRRTQADLS